MMRKVADWAGTAFNQVPDSENQIHSDAMAEAYGFTGALVPGVTVSAYLIHPAIAAWGMDWLDRGRADVTVRSPVYDDAPFEVTTTPAEGGYSARLTSGDRQCADAVVDIADADPPGYRGDPALDPGHVPPEATPENMERLRDSGCPAARFHWSAAHPMATCLRDPAAMPALLRTDGAPGSGGYANPAFLLGCANRHFASVAHMNPWIHLATRSQNHQAVALDTDLVSEMAIRNLWIHKGHAFADCDFHLFRADTLECVCVVEQRAIYRVRPPG